jgi:hypothetical protein
MQSSVRVRPLLSKRRCEIAFGEIADVEQIQLSFGQGVRLRTSKGEEYFYTYEAARLVAELARQGVVVRAGITRLRLSDLPR